MNKRQGFIARASALLATATLGGLLVCAPVFARSAAPAVGANPGQAVVTVERSFNKPCYNSIPVTVFVDGKPMGQIGGGQVMSVRVPEGTHEVGIAMHPTNTSPRSVTVVASPQHPAMLRANLASSGYSIRLAR